VPCTMGTGTPGPVFYRAMVRREDLPADALPAVVDALLAHPPVRD
jgi:hypothetical protein